MSTNSARRKVVIFASADDQIGGGHLSRQQTLANELLKLGFSVSLVGKTSKAQLAKLREIGLEVLSISDPSSVEEHESALLEINSNNSIQCIVVDNYNLLEQVSNGVTFTLTYPQVHFQDGQEAAPGGSILVNSGVSPSEPYAHGDYETIFLGLDAVLISEEIKELRNHRSANSQPIQDTPRGFITLGYGGQGDLMYKLTDALLEMNSDLSRNFKFARKEPINGESEKSNDIGVRSVSTVGYAEALSSFDICIGAAGLSAYERAFLGIPSINIPLAKNQIGIARILGSSGAALQLPLSDKRNFVADLRMHLNYLGETESREAMVRASELLVNPESARKISYAISQL